MRPLEIAVRIEASRVEVVQKLIDLGAEVGEG